MQRKSIKTSIWLDPEFRSLSSDAQWIYLGRKFRDQREPVTVELLQSWASDGDPIELEKAIAELAATRFGYVLKRAIARKKITPELRIEIYERDGFKCVTCGTSENLEIDHIIPLAKGGTDDPANLQTMCAPHNRKKGTKIDGLVQDGRRIP